MTRQRQKVSHNQAGKACASILRVNLAIAEAAGTAVQLSNPRFKTLRNGGPFRVFFLQMADVLEQEAKEIRLVLNDKSI